MARLEVEAQRRHKRRNRLQAALLLGGMVVVLGLCAWLMAGVTGVVPHRRRTPETLLLRTHPPAEERILRLRELVPQHAEFSAPEVLSVT